MTKKELLNQLEKYPDSIDILLKFDDGEFNSHPVEKVTEEEVLWSEDGHLPDLKSEPWAKQKCVVLSR